MRSTLDMFNPKWQVRYFYPLVKQAKKKGVNVESASAFEEWILSQAKRKDSTIDPGIQWFVREFDSQDWEELINEALS